MTEVAGPKLYRGGDLLGTLLSHWRAVAAGRYIESGKLVDLACGDNRLVRRLGFGEGIDCQAFNNVDLVLNDFSRLPYESQSIDTVAILAALNYLHDPKSVIVEVLRVLKPQGKLIISMLNPR